MTCFNLVKTSLYISGQSYSYCLASLSVGSPIRSISNSVKQSSIKTARVSSALFTNCRGYICERTLLFCGLTASPIRRLRSWNLHSCWLVQRTRHCANKTLSGTRISDTTGREWVGQSYSSTDRNFSSAGQSYFLEWPVLFFSVASSIIGRNSTHTSEGKLRLTKQENRIGRTEK